MTGADSPIKILIVLVIALVVLGPSRLPELGRSLGQGIREFRQAVETPSEASPAEPPAPTGHQT
jgi:sec-independent protein translocase protein TatA